MSDIVRPTRDGIHGREYISTAVDIGRKPLALKFDGMELTTKCPPLVTVPLPVIFDVMSRHEPPLVVKRAIAAAAERLSTIALFHPEDLASEIKRHATSVGLSLSEDILPEDWLRYAPVIELPDSDQALWWIEHAKNLNSDLIGIVRIKSDQKAAQRAVDLAKEGAEVIHIVADECGYEFEANPRHITEALRDVHLKLVQEGLRDEVTLIASGGIALAEHVAKSIICGADLVAIDIPLMIALECKICGKCKRGLACPEDLDGLNLAYAVQRIVNLMGAWHLQLIEVLGAMGIREVRRLRGEIGRAMFVEELEQETFGKMFGKGDRRA
jgi:hypothetical protein